MLPHKSVLLAILWQLITVEGGLRGNRLEDDWNNWIILPARSGTSDRSDLNILSGFGVNESDVNGYFQPVQMEPYIVKVKEKNEKNPKENYNKVTTPSDDDDYNSNDDVIVPLGRAIEKVKDFCAIVKDFFEEDYNAENEGRAKATSSSTRKLKKIKKKYKKLLLPLLIAYKLKFLTLIPVLIGGLVLLVGTTGLAGFFFALFAAVMSLKTDHKFEIKKW